ncbi:hypothetical protein Plec18167_004302 [Paecilomyces lecythidis]|uniref:HNH nuclease domain-containing protein n=1 Tax=Paecilomyces lecythidis TaxID=3004212 RepID=A0ABR3XTT5_9EURO
MPPKKRKVSDPSYNPRSQKRGSRRAQSTRQSVSGSSVHAAATSTSVPAETEPDPIQQAIEALGTTADNAATDVDTARERLKGYTEGKKRDITDKVLYSMLDMIPDAEGKTALAQDINSRQSDEDLRLFLQRVAKIWAFIFRYFPSVKGVLDPRSSGQVNMPRNAMTISSGLHPVFGGFDLALEHIESTRYRIKTFWALVSHWDQHLPESRIIDLQPANETEAPSQILLTVHCAIANILHASGMAEEIDEELERDEDELEALAEDGSTNLEEVIGRWLLKAH